MFWKFFTMLGVAALFCCTANKKPAAVKPIATVKMGPIISIEYIPAEMTALEWGVDAPEE